MGLDSCESPTALGAAATGRKMLAKATHTKMESVSSLRVFFMGHIISVLFLAAICETERVVLPLTLAGMPQDW